MKQPSLYGGVFLRKGAAVGGKAGTWAGPAPCLPAQLLSYEDGWIPAGWAGIWAPENSRVLGRCLKALLGGLPPHHRGEQGGSRMRGALGTSLPFKDKNF